MDDLDTYIASRKARPWWQKTWEYVRYRLPYILRHLPRDTWNAISCFVQCGRKGWSRQDVWRIDAHLSRVIPQMLRELIRQTKGFSTPGSFVSDDDVLDGEVFTADGVGDADNDRWIAWLDKVASAFEDYYDLMCLDIPWDKARYERDLDTMRELFDHFSDLWS